MYHITEDGATASRPTPPERVQGARVGHTAQPVGHVLLPDPPRPAALPSDAALQHPFARCLPTS